MELRGGDHLLRLIRVVRLELNRYVGFIRCFQIPEEYLKIVGRESILLIGGVADCVDAGRVQLRKRYSN